VRDVNHVFWMYTSAQNSILKFLLAMHGQLLLHNNLAKKLHFHIYSVHVRNREYF
jgi:hypothetical protein